MTRSSTIGLVFAALLLGFGCNRDNGSSTVSSDSLAASDEQRDSLSDSASGQTGADDPIRQEFIAIAERIEQSENRYLGRAQIPSLESQLKTTTEHQTRVNLLLQLCWNQLRLGHIEEAERAIVDAFNEVEKHSGKIPSSMYKLRALVHLREAEYRNCISRHNPDCCVFPLAGGGIHSVPQPMQKAREYLLLELNANPRSLEAAWLLNLSSMATGNYPNDIPEYLRLPESALTSPQDIGRFADVAGELGVDTFNLCGGAIVDDFNGDRFLDIVTSTYDPRGSLTFYVNNGDGTFSDRSQASGLSSQLGGLNCIAADYDNDGDLDVYVLRGAWLDDDGQIRNSLLQNDGTGNFADVTREAKLDGKPSPTQAGAWADFDNDGWLDLFVGNESRVEIEKDGSGSFPSQLFHNQGDGTFREIAASAGVTNDRYCKGVAAADYDGDGDIDLYVSNRGKNRLYRNHGSLKFTDFAEQAGVEQPSQQSFASWFFDFDNDGRLDLFVAAYQATNADVAAGYFALPHQGVAPCLYRNLGNGKFESVAESVGLTRAYLPMGANFGDIDNDGFLDIYLTTGRPDFAALMPNVMLRNDNATSFVDVTFGAGFGHLQKGHGIAFADIDNDGDQDIYHQLGGFFPSDKFHNALFANPGHGNRFVTLKLIGTESNRNAIGSRIQVTIATPSGSRDIYRTVGAVSSFGGSPYRQEIGLGRATAIDVIHITWPKTGRRETLENVPLDSFIEVVENNGWSRDDVRSWSNSPAE
ncbi:MAG: CRTAC1 family protein [Planctomycetales bacterium]|nr:CRTAC1 family protein [Planctomycetales bacterium]